MASALGVNWKKIVKTTLIYTVFYSKGRSKVEKGVKKIFSGYASLAGGASGDGVDTKFSKTGSTHEPQRSQV